MYLLKNVTLYDGHTKQENMCIEITDDKITGIYKENEIRPGIPVYDLKSKVIAPGFIDVQVNGGGGVFFNDAPTAESIKTIYEAHKKFGTTTYLPTLITTDFDKMKWAVQAVKEYIDKGEKGVLGIHLEGPYINSEKAGVHEKSCIRPLSRAEIDELLSIDNRVIQLLTLAPEVVADNDLAYLLSKGIHLSAGHTNASYKQVTHAFEQGITLATHLFNAMSQFGSREPGVVGAVYDHDDVWSNIIVDGYHVDYASVRVSYKMKPKGKLFLVTDAMPPVGKEDCEFEIAGKKVSTVNGKCTTPDGTLAGSALDMNTAVKNCVNHVGIPLDEALRMASTYAADYLGVGDSLGYVKKGYKADLVILDQNLDVTAVIKDGEIEELTN